MSEGMNEDIGSDWKTDCWLKNFCTAIRPNHPLMMNLITLMRVLDLTKDPVELLGSTLKETLQESKKNWNHISTKISYDKNISNVFFIVFTLALFRIVTIFTDFISVDLYWNKTCNNANISDERFQRTVKGKWCQRDQLRFDPTKCIVLRANQKPSDNFQTDLLCSTR